MSKNSKEYNKAHYEKYKDKKKQYALENKEQIKEYKKKYYAERKITFREQQQEYYRDPVNRAKRILWKARDRARRDGLEFDLTLEDIVIPTHCPYLGVELTHELGKGQLQSNSSLDRKDSSKGYIKGNVEVISRLANSMKTNATQEQLVAFAKAVLARHEESK